MRERVDRTTRRGRRSADGQLKELRRQGVYWRRGSTVSVVGEASRAASRTSRPLSAERQIDVEMEKSRRMRKKVAEECGRKQRSRENDDGTWEGIQHGEWNASVLIRSRKQNVEVHEVGHQKRLAC